MAQIRKINQADRRYEERDLPLRSKLEGTIIERIEKYASKIRLSTSLFLLPTNFGWILTGNRNGITVNEIMVIHINLENLGNDLRRFWDLETIGISPTNKSH